MAAPNRHMELRPLGLDDIATVVEIEKEAYPDPWTKGMFVQEVHSDQSCFYTAYVDNELVGYGGFWLVTEEAHITSVTICREYRGQGLGRLLVETLLDTAAAHGAVRALLEVRESNQVARQLYETTGFKQVGMRRNYYTKSREHAIVMVRPLGPREA